jgi:hypothetical protein
MAKATADQIRDFVDQNYLRSARASGQAQVTVRAGTVHSQMHLKDQMPQVCGALGAKKFQTAHRVTPISQVGPHHGANKEFKVRV